MHNFLQSCEIVTFLVLPFTFRWVHNFIYLLINDLFIRCIFLLIFFNKSYFTDCSMSFLLTLLLLASDLSSQNYFMAILPLWISYLYTVCHLSSLVLLFYLALSTFKYTQILTFFLAPYSIRVLILPNDQPYLPLYPIFRSPTNYLISALIDPVV